MHEERALAGSCRPRRPAVLRSCTSTASRAAPRRRSLRPAESRACRFASVWSAVGERATSESSSTGALPLRAAWSCSANGSMRSTTTWGCSFDASNLCLRSNQENSISAQSNERWLRSNDSTLGRDRPTDPKSAARRQVVASAHRTSPRPRCCRSAPGAAAPAAVLAASRRSPAVPASTTVREPRSRVAFPST